MFTYTIISLLMGLASCQVGDIVEIPSKEEIDEIKKPSLGDNFFIGLRYHGEHVIFVEAGSFHIEACAWRGAIKKTIYKPAYQWVGPNHKMELRNHRFKVLPSGDLMMIRPSVSDSGVYYCRIINKEYHSYFEEYERSILVFIPPVWVKEIHFFFLVPSCSSTYKKHSVDSTQKFFCQNDVDCLYTSRYEKCFSTAEFTSMSELRVGVHQYLHDGFSSLLPANCGVKCVNNASQMELDRYSERTIREMRFYMRLAHREKSKILLIDKKTATANIPVCVSGFKLYSQNVCVPCDKGEARSVNVDDQSCATCGMLSYSAFFGESTCSYCPLFKVAPRHGTSNKDDCVWFFKSITAMAIAIPSAIFLTLVVGFIISLCTKGDTENQYKLCKYFSDMCCYENESARDKGIKAKHKAFMQEMKTT